MKHQQVNVDYWQMFKTTASYLLLTVVGWMVIRMTTAIFTMPQRLRAQQDRIKNSLEELQRRYPDLEDEVKKLEEEMKTPTPDDDVNDRNKDGESIEEKKEN